MTKEGTELSSNTQKPTYLKELQTLLVRLLDTPSPTGDTREIIQLLERECESCGLTTRRNRKGGLLIDLPGRDTTKRRFITAHVDTLGAMVKEILPSGRLRLHKIGGYAWNTVEGEYCGVKTQDGAVITGTVILHNTSVHVNGEVEKTARNNDNIEVVLDAKVSTAEEAQALGVSVGDFVYWDPRIQVTESGFIKSRHLDDKASVAIVLQLLRELTASKTTLPYNVTVLISNNEEIGYGGNSNVPDDTVEYLAVDMGAIGDGQTTDEYCVSICAKDGSGPYHLGLRQHLVELAKANNLYYKVDIYPNYSSDASAAIRAGSDIVHGLIGPGVANSHAYERSHLEALENTYQLLYAYLLSETLQA
ncbi:M42 family metallopeptidase [Alicyclobacillus ferrooxydans]|uniref:Peptidase M42 n=1 Tax=Alicyclobacillus ferrooxydans TaxID=471514 RepID=A0A0P9CCP9_9BACL|nr:M42 family metallopeptidase [Alicyclobacillus ferrooxydans]KPV43335.1 peptidase M42 [Alicyclobacillus ferrooxydans]